MSSIQNNSRQVTARRDGGGVIAVAITSHVTVEAASYCSRRSAAGPTDNSDPVALRCAMRTRRTCSTVHPGWSVNRSQPTLRKVVGVTHNRESLGYLKERLGGSEIDADLKPAWLVRSADKIVSPSSLNP